ncbi:girdin-like [Mytilus californianus]|uniref:girdin-like n=1 Tax=Mytilus californianus TaxID=6549 RepID=UPI0022450BEF|nr:girdin-like [Mytilus californianus]XP_052079864.1 girdin-like [Mytilus californianus]
MQFIWLNLLGSALKRVMHPTEIQNDGSKFSWKDGYIIICGVVVFYILTYYIGVLGSSGLLGVIVACSCWIISIRERNDTIQQLDKAIDRIRRENEYLKSQILQYSYSTNKLQEKMLVQHQLKQLESENKLHEEKHLSRQKCEEVARNMGKYITRCEEKRKDVALSLQQQQLENQKYNRICSELSENLDVAHNEIKWTESQLQASIAYTQRERRTHEEYEKMSRTRLQKLEAEKRTHEEYEKMSRTRLQKLEAEKRTHEEYEKMSRTRLQKLEAEKRTHEEYEKMSRTRLQKLEAENRALKDIQKKYEENVIRLKGLQNTVSTTYKELERMKNEKCSWSAKSNELKQTIKDMEKAQHDDFYSKRQVDAIYKLTSGKTDYDRLGIRPGATKADVKTAYKKLSILVHPDKNAAPGSEDAFKILQNAKNSLFKNCV